MMRLESLLRAVRAGEPQAWSRLAGALSKRLYTYFRRWTSHEEAQDLAQDTVVVVLEKLSILESDESLEGWLVGVARNLQRAEKRTQARDAKLRQDLAVLGVAPTGPSTIARKQEIIRILNEEIEQLPTKMRVAVEHKLAEGKSKALADLQGVAPSTVRTWQSNGFERLEDRVRQRTKTPERDVSKLTAATTPIPS